MEPQYYRVHHQYYKVHQYHMVNSGPVDKDFHCLFIITYELFLFSI